MKFFVDTADIAEIRDLAATGLVDGVTTNPSLIAKSGAQVPRGDRRDLRRGRRARQRRGRRHSTMPACWPKGRKLAEIAHNVVRQGAADAATG